MDDLTQAELLRIAARSFADRLGPVITVKLVRRCKANNSGISGFLREARELLNKWAECSWEELDNPPPTKRELRKTKKLSQA